MLVYQRVDGRPTHFQHTDYVVSQDIHRMLLIINHGEKYKIYNMYLTNLRTRLEIESFPDISIKHELWNNFFHLVFVFVSCSVTACIYISICLPWRCIHIIYVHVNVYCNIIFAANDIYIYIYLFIYLFNYLYIYIYVCICIALVSLELLLKFPSFKAEKKQLRLRLLFLMFELGLSENGVYPQFQRIKATQIHQK